MRQLAEWAATAFRFVLAGLLIAALVVFARPIGRLFFPVPHAPIVKQEANARGVDPFLIVALVRVESGFDPNAQSPKGAMGLMQLLPETADEVARKLGEELADVRRLYDPAVNIRLGTAYFAELMTGFGGRVAVALAAYNGGGANVRRWLDEGVWSGEEAHIGDIPFPETRNFVGRVLRFRDLYRFLYEDDWSLTDQTRRARDPSPFAPALRQGADLFAELGSALSRR